MYELVGRIKDLAIDFRSKEAVLTLSITNKNDAENCFDELNNAEKLVFKIGKYREKRSLDSNAYAWVLMDRLAEKLNMTKEEIYKGYIKEIGGVSEVVCVKNEAVEKLCEGGDIMGLGGRRKRFRARYLVAPT